MVDETLTSPPDLGIAPRSAGSCCGGTAARAKPEDDVARAKSSCCGGTTTAAPTAPVSSCCAPAPAVSGCCGSDVAGPRRTDWFLVTSGALAALGYAWHLLFGAAAAHTAIDHFGMAVYELLNTMWWGVLLGIVFVGLLDRVPRDVIIAALAGERRSSGILRATAAGVAFDLCSHGILMVGMKLYERGATIGQTVAFLLASPWNSFSLTIILIALVGWWYTALFIVLSAVIAVITGYVFDILVERGTLPANPARAATGRVPDLRSALREWLAGKRLSLSALPEIARTGLSGSRTVLRWLLFGVVLAAAIRALVPADIFATWFGPTLVGVVLTVIAATIIEVCSEGATPIAADLLTRAAAPGNGFVFLMGGVATDYTEIMSLKETTHSWKIALFLPLIALPQTILIGVLLNVAG